MSASLEPDQNDSAIGGRFPWFNPVLYAFLAALVILITGMCCWSPMISVFLPPPDCIGGYGAQYAQDVRALTFVEMIAALAIFPFALIFGALSGLAVFFLLRTRKSANLITLGSALAGVVVGLSFDIALPITINRVICNL
jgi:hypothetical protein